MKKILVTGEGSYIGNSFAAYLNGKEEYSVDIVDVISDAWKKCDFSSYDAIYHVAGIAHIKETKENAGLYYKVNRDLAVEIAKKAKTEGTGQFIYMSSMSVYGMETGVINRETQPAPKSNYGKSKLEAEKLLEELSDEQFRVCLLRPPMVYGNGCKGNFRSVIKLVRSLPFFPKVDNKRSSIYIDNLCEFVKLAVDRQLCGVYFPQNRDYMNTSAMALLLARKLGKKLVLSSFLGFGVKLLIPFLPIAKKAFGSLIYADTEQFDWCYCVKDGDDSVELSV